MNQLTKQELQSALSQLRDNIVGNMATKQDVKATAINLSQQVTNQNQIDVQRIISTCNDRLFVRTEQSFKQHSTYLHVLSDKIDNLSKKMSTIEHQLDKLDLAMNGLRAELDSFTYEEPESQPQPTLSTAKSVKFMPTYSY